MPISGGLPERVVETGTGGTYGATTVGTTATLFTAANTERLTLSLYNNHATAIVYVGTDASVTTANGMPIPPQSERLIDMSGDVYAVSDTAGTDVRWLAEVIA